MTAKFCKDMQRLDLDLHAWQLFQLNLLHVLFQFHPLQIIKG